MSGRPPAKSRTEPYSPSARANAGRPGGEAGQQVGEDDAAEDREAAGAQRGSGLLHLPVHLDQQRLHGADDEGKGDEEEGDDNRGPSQSDVDAERAVSPRRAPAG